MQIKFEKTIIDLFEQSVLHYANNVLLKENKTGEYESTTYAEVKNEVYRFGAGLMSLGLQKGDRVALLSEGRNDWLVGELGVLYTGATNVPLSIKLEAKTELKFRLVHSEARFLIVSSNLEYQIETIRDEIPSLERVIYIDKEVLEHEQDMTFSKVKELGDEFLIEHSEDFKSRYSSVIPADYANISYTSGTTSDPKGIILSHKNYAGNVIQSNTLTNIHEDYTIFIILPWDHAFAHTAGLYSVIVNGATVASVQNGKTPLETLRNIPKNMNQLKPDFMLSVPALAKNFRKNIEQGIAKKGETARKMFNFALGISYRYQGDGWNKGKGGRFLLKPLASLFDKILYSKIRDNFGGKLKFFIGGGALLDTELQRFFYAIGIPMCQGYGLSESSPVISSNTPENIKFGTSGKLVKHMELKICDLDGKELPNEEKGEIVIKGDNVMEGYWKNPEATKETVIDGWLYTGDMGYMGNDTYLYVLGRFKSLLIGNDGEKFSPEGIEEALVDQSSLLEQCMLYNDQSPYTVGFIVPNYNALKSKVKGIENEEERTEKILEMIQAEVDEYKPDGKYEDMFPIRWIPSAIVVLPESFNESNHLMNSTMKMVRGKIIEYFSKELVFVYTAEAKSIINNLNKDNLKKWEK